MTTKGSGSGLDRISRYIYTHTLVCGLVVTLVVGAKVQYWYNDKGKVTKARLLLTPGTHQLPGQCLHPQLLRCLFPLGQGLVIKT